MLRPSCCSASHTASSSRSSERFRRSRSFSSSLSAVRGPMSAVISTACISSRSAGSTSFFRPKICARRAMNPPRVVARPFLRTSTRSLASASLGAGAGAATFTATAGRATTASTLGSAGASTESSGPSSGSGSASFSGFFGASAGFSSAFGFSGSAFFGSAFLGSAFLGSGSAFFSAFLLGSSAGRVCLPSGRDGASSLRPNAKYAPTATRTTRAMTMAIVVNMHVGRRRRCAPRAPRRFGRATIERRARSRQRSWGAAATPASTRAASARIAWSSSSAGASFA